MKKRWMKSIIETSTQATPDLPFARRVRHAARMAPQPLALKTA